VLQATLEVLWTRGFESLELPEVARRAGVHASTIYRRWGSKSRLVGEAVLERGSPLRPTPDTGTLRGDLMRLVQDGTELLRTPPVRALFMVLLDDPGAQSAELEEARARLWQAHVSDLAAIVDRAVLRSELPASTDPESLADLVVAPAFFRAVVTGQDLGSGQAASIVEQALRATGARPIERPRGT
jgi:AcrR family transcriptional regulator